MYRLPGVGELEAAGIAVDFDSPEQLYDATEEDLQQPWIPFSSTDELYSALEEAGFDRPAEVAEDDKVTIPGEVDIGGEVYQFLGVDEQDVVHFYRVNPGSAELAYFETGEDGLLPHSRKRIEEGDPVDRLRSYVHNRGWKRHGEVEDPGFRHLSPPEYRPDLNEGLGGTVFLDDEAYVFPARLESDKVFSVLEEQAEESDDVVVDYRPQYFELHVEDAVEDYRLIPELRGNSEITGTEVVDRIGLVDGDDVEIFELDDLMQDHFVEQLAGVDGVDEDLAQDLIDEYGNLRTASWAVTSDTEFFEEEFGLNAHEMFKEFGEAGVYRNEQSSESGTLNFPERRADELEDEDDGKPEDTEQAKLDF